jgi:hypothetical protein
MYGPSAHRSLPALLAGVLMFGSAAPTWAVPSAARTEPAESASPAASATATAPAGASLPGGSRTYEVSLKQLGALYPLQLRGIEGSNGVPFSIRADEIVTRAKLKLTYTYSPALLPELSHINVIVNDEVAATIPVPKETAGANLTREIDIPPRMITEFSRLDLKLIGHYTMQCEDPAHSSLWANVSNNSSIELTVAPLALENDLALLPLPFFDRRDVRSLSLPFVFASAPPPGSLEAAGALSSWFGAMAGYRGATFTANLGQLPPTGSAVVLLAGNEQVPGLNSSAVQGPTVSIVPNPRDPRGKLLLVQGRDLHELKVAANALSTGSQALSGQTATITQFAELKPRQPYDAPNWLSTTGPVKFGDLAQAQTLNVSGYSPDLVRINTRLPPDLFGWRDKGIPIDLRYRYTPRPSTDKSTLNININQQFVAALPLFAAERGGGNQAQRLMAQLLPDGTAASQRDLRIPLFKLPSKSQLQFHYYYDIAKQGDCKDVILDNVKGAIEPDSTIDVSGYKHFIAMPDLAAFGNSGFPFTRLADLSETAVVLPDAPVASDYAVYLTLLGRMGESTGYPATAVQVVPAQQVQSVADKDLLVLSSGPKQPLLTQWASSLPFSLDGDSKRFALSDLVYRAVSWWDPSRAERLVQRKQMSITSTSTDTVIAGFESPQSSGRSVVLVSSNQPAGLTDAVVALQDQDAVKLVQGSLAVIRGKQVNSLVAAPSYYVGSLGPVLYAQWFLSQRPFLLLVASILSAVLVGVVLYLTLRARARRRLT